MENDVSLDERLSRLRKAFHDDGLIVQQVPGCTGKDYILKDGRIGMFGIQNDFANCRPKRVYYVEGTPFTIGWLIGYMAEPEVHKMASEYKDDVIFDFVDMDREGESGLGRIVQDLLLNITRRITAGMKDEIPSEYDEELKGIASGCKAVNPNTKVAIEDLWTLNAGLDAILSHLYTGRLFARRIPAAAVKVRPACNAFVAPSDRRTWWFGRDFMWPTAGVLQDTACIIIYKPDHGHRFVSQTAPGFVGSLVAMNVRGVAAGVDAFTSALADPKRPGFNSLTLVRHVAQWADSAERGVDVIAEAPRGVPWIYPIADAEGKAYIVEAGKTVKDPRELWRCVSLRYRRALRRKKEALLTSADLRKGSFARSMCFKPPPEIMSLNRGLWHAHNHDFGLKVWDAFTSALGALRSAVRIHRARTVVRVHKARLHKVRAAGTKAHSGGKGFCALLKELISRFRKEVYTYQDSYFDPEGFINTTRTEKNCPGPFYFAPSRDVGRGAVVATNFSLAPAMRLTSMTRWIALIGEGMHDDFQWRYDTLSQLLRDALKAHPGGLQAGEAWDIINFLTPEPGKGQFTDYYDPKGKRWQDIPVKASVSLLDLGEKTMKSQFGCYGDAPVTVNLLRY